MTLLVSLTTLFLVLCSAHAVTDKNADKELLSVYVIFRHGARTPVDTYPTDPYINATFSPFGWGTLTNKGKQAMFENGLFVRERYNNFLGDIYNYKEFYVQTTDSDRTKMSAQLMNAGIWPPAAHQKWGKLDWQPIPTNYEPLDQDNLLLVRKPCPKYNQEIERLEKEEVKQLLDMNSELFANLTAITGMRIKDFEDVQSLYSTLRAEEDFGLKLPDWTKDYYPNKLLPATEFSFILNAYNDQLKRYKGGVFLKKIMSDLFQKTGHALSKRSADFYKYLIREKRDADEILTDPYVLLSQWSKEVGQNVAKERKMTLYAGHDSTISNLLSALKVWESQVPDYGSTIILEFSKDTKTNDFGLEIYLRNRTDVPPYKLTVPGCESFCSLPKLAKLVEPVIPRNRKDECKSDDPNYVPPPQGGP